MNRTLLAAAASGGFCLLAGCEHAENYRWASGPDPVISGEANAPAGSAFGDWKSPAVVVYSYAVRAPAPPAPASSKLSIKDLSDHGQAALVEALAKPGADVKTIMGSIATSGAIDTGGDAAAVPDVEGSYGRTLVATVTKGMDAGPGDRLVWTWIDIKPVNFDFAGYTIVSTDNETLQIEQVQNQSSASLQAQAGKTASDTNATTTTGAGFSDVLTKALGASLGVTGSLSNQYTTSAAINQQYVKLSADIVPNELRIYHESERNLDVAGNTIIALTLKVNLGALHPPALPIEVQRVSKTKLSDATTGAPLAPGDVTLQAALDASPPGCPLLADVTLVYNMRHITQNARSYVEGEQKAEFRQGSVATRHVLLVPAADVRPPSWSVFAAGDAYRTNPLMLIGNGETALPLDFTSYAQASDFAVWLNQNAGWMLNDAHRKIGRAGLALGWRIDGSGPAGPYFAAHFHDQAINLAVPPAEQQAAAARECAGMAKR